MHSCKIFKCGHNYLCTHHSALCSISSWTCKLLFSYDFFATGFIMIGSWHNHCSHTRETLTHWLKLYRCQWIILCRLLLYYCQHIKQLESLSNTMWTDLVFDPVFVVCNKSMVDVNTPHLPSHLPLFNQMNICILFFFSIQILIKTWINPRNIT